MKGKPEKLRSVYVIKSTGGICKIGISNDPEDRLRQLLTGHGLGLELVHVEVADDEAARLIERAAHRMLEKAKTGGEWFRVSADKAIQVVQIAAWIVNDCRRHTERRSRKVEKKERSINVTEAEIERVQAWKKYRTSAGNGEESAGDCFSSFQFWCRETGRPLISLVRFSWIMKEVLETPFRSKDGRTLYQGFKLASASLYSVKTA